MAQGAYDPAFGQVAELLDTAVEAAGRGGAAVCVYHQGRPVVDVWTGAADETGTPWREDNLAVSYSTTKGVVATALHICVDRRLLDYDDRVAEHWPEFGRNGKEDITVRQVLCHEAGLFDVASFLTGPEMVLDWEAMIAGIEAMAPAFTPGTANGYHAVTFGYLVGELVRRVSGLGIGEFVQCEIAEPLGLDGCFVGLHPDHHERLVQILPPTGRGARALLDDPGKMVELAAQLGLTVHPDLIVAALPPTLLEARATPEWVEAPMPSGNGCFTARSLARMYAALANGGELDGVRLLSEKTVARATEVQNDRPDLVIAFPMMWRLGYHGVITTAGVPEQAFGHYGFGGSGAWADPERELAIGLTLNALGNALAGDNRLLELGGAAMRAAES
ncbi:MAG TPA: serine hydrolase domain-containing protein [Acidimicrobiia bacterium]|nr:serine hydrolase domain-containing protein [Acidimicrobiia bacterium]